MQPACALLCAAGETQGALGSVTESTGKAKSPQAAGGAEQLSTRCFALPYFEGAVLLFEVSSLPDCEQLGCEASPAFSVKITGP